MSPPPRGLIEHEGRLDILCCFEADEPLTAAAIGARTGESSEATTYHLKPLLSHGLVRRTGEQEDGEPLYESCLEDQPKWVREAVEKQCRGGN
jgi:DNA-binding transcriptional ArsR family regulator